jgi:hypothetical protein
VSLAIGILLFLPAASFAPRAGAQSSGTDSEQVAASAPLNLIRWSGTLPQAAGKSVDVTFDIYETASDTVSLWNETQKVTVGADGRYSVLLGAASPEGIPPTLFPARTARWVEARLRDTQLIAATDGDAVNSSQHTRSLLTAVPYAFRSVDAETLAGRPAQDYVTVEDLKSSVIDQVRSLSDPALVTRCEPLIGTAQTSLSPIAITAGGTGAGTPAGALANLGAQVALPGVTSDGSNGINVAGNFAADAVSPVTISGFAYAADYPGSDIGAKINAAIQALPASPVGGTIYISASVNGCQPFTTQIVVDRPVHLIGSGFGLNGAGSCLNWAGGAYAAIAVNGGGGSAAQSSVLEDFSLLNSGSGTVGIDIYNGQYNVILRDLAVDVVGGRPFSVAGVRVGNNPGAFTIDTKLENVRIANQVIGLQILQANTTRCETCHIYNSSAANVEVGDTSHTATATSFAGGNVEQDVSNAPNFLLYNSQVLTLPYLYTETTGSDATVISVPSNGWAVNTKWDGGYYQANGGTDAAFLSTASASTSAEISNIYYTDAGSGSTIFSNSAFTSLSARNIHGDGSIASISTGSATGIIAENVKLTGGYFWYFPAGTIDTLATSGTLAAAVTTRSIGNSPRASINIPPADGRLGLISAQYPVSDTICALHTDTISGATCNNTVTDGTTVTAFNTIYTIPSNTLAAGVTYRVAATFLLSSPATQPTFNQFQLLYGSTSLFRLLNPFTTDKGQAGNTVSATFQVTFPTSTTGIATMTNNFTSTAHYGIGHDGIVTVNGTFAQALSINIQYNANTAGNSLTLVSLLVYRDK